MRIQAIGTLIMHNFLLNPEKIVLIYIFTYLFFIKISRGLLDIFIKNIIFILILIVGIKAQNYILGLEP